MRKKLQTKIKELYRDLVYKYKIEKNIVKGDKILITSTDGLGDFIVREKLLLETINTYGKENIYILIKKELKELVKKYGILEDNIIIFTKEDRYKIRNTKSCLEKISKIGVKTIYSYERALHDLWFQKYFRDIKKICLKDYWRSESIKIQSNYDQIIEIKDKKIESITEQTMWHIEALFNKKYTLKEVRPDISSFYEKNARYKEVIAFGIGSADRKRIMSPTRLEEILLAIRKEYPERYIYLLGTGVYEEKIIKKMSVIKSDDKIIDLVGKTSLNECCIILNSCKIFIGMDSGLYNLSFGMRKKTIGLFETRDVPFAHKGIKEVVVIEGHGGEEEYFGVPGLNGIKVEDVLKILEEELK